jgi:hypothetical protein
MSNITLFSSANVPAFARNNELSDTARALTGGSVSNTKRISIKGGVFRLLAGGKEVAAIDDRHLEVVIVKAAPKLSRIFYAAQYDAENIVPPDCWSNDGEHPDASAQNRQAETCMACPQNIAGSGQNNSRACRFQQRLAVVLADNIAGDVMQLTLPATSVFGKEEGDKRALQAYARYLAVQNPPVNPEQIVTEMRFDTKAESPKLFFKPVRWLNDEENEVAKEHAASTVAQRAIVMTVAQSDGVKNNAPKMAISGTRPMGDLTKEEDAPAYEPIAEKAEKAKKAKPVVDAEDEPEVRKDAAKASAVPAKKGKLADLVSEWDDE